MNFDKLSSFGIGIVIAAAMAGNLDRFNHWVQMATAKVLWESRASAWGSPYFFKEHTSRFKLKYQTKEVHHARNH